MNFNILNRNSTCNNILHFLTIGTAIGLTTQVMKQVVEKICPVKDYPKISFALRRILELTGVSFGCALGGIAGTIAALAVLTLFAINERRTHKAKPLPNDPRQLQNDPRQLQIDPVLIPAPQALALDTPPKPTIERSPIHRPVELSSPKGNPKRGTLNALSEVEANRPIQLGRLKLDGVSTYSSTATYYSYNAEEIADAGWGCAWRAIQTCASPFLPTRNNIQINFSSLFNQFGIFENLEKIYQDKYPEKTLPAKKPDDTEWVPYNIANGWAEPFIGEMVLHYYGISAELATVNGRPGCYTPASVFEDKKNYNVTQFFNRLKEHFSKENPPPVMIDNGTFSMNIVGIRETENSNIVLFIADPHLKAGVNRDENNNFGLYTITFNSAGIKIGCSLDNHPEHRKMFYYASFSSVENFANNRWMVLFPTSPTS